MSVLPVGFGSSGGIDVGDIGHSLRLRAAASAYFSRTPASAGNSKTWTFSVRGKRGTLGAGAQAILSAGPGSNTDFGIISFDYSGYADKICVIDYPGGGSVDLRSTRVCRDTSGHYHLVVTIDTTQATAADRVKIWWNNEQITAFDSATYPSLNADTRFNSTSMHYIGAGRYLATSSYYDGLLSDVHFVDGQALTPSSFGEQNADGVWVPKPYTGTYGANGFKLDFADAAVTSGSNAGLGKDTSGNGNYWNTNNISVTAGVTYDSMVDTPTNNYATINALDYNNTYLTLSAANLQQTYAGVTAAATSRGTLGIPTTDKWYWEVYITATGGGSGERIRVGICKDEAISGNTIDNSATHYMQMSNGQKRTGTTDSTYGSSFSATQIMQVLYDADAGSLYFGQNNSFANGTGIFDQLWSGAAAAFTGLSGQFFPAQITYGGADIAINFGQRPFTYTPPTGFKALCTANLPAVAIKKPASHFDVTTWVSNQTDGKTVTGLAFQPDFFWAKERGVGRSHNLFNAVTGVTKSLRTDGTDAEQTIAVSATGKLKTFNSDGYTFGADTDSSYGSVNYGTTNHVGWNWKAGGTPSTDNVAGAGNTPTAGSVKIDGANLGSALAGSIAATRLSANTTAGFSIVTYTGTGANATVAHGLGKAPSFVIVKNRDWASGDWGVYHQNLTSAAYFLLLNSTAAQASSATLWNSTAPTTTVFSLGTSNATNLSTNKHVAYCFAEVPGYSKFGSYVGNGSTDGPFVFCGFRPRFILVKRSDAGAENWLLWDSSRMTYNVSSLEIKANLANAEADVAAANGWDQTSNGFKLRSGNSIFNTSTATYIYAAFAEHPFGGSNCAPAPAR